MVKSWCFSSFLFFNRRLPFFWDANFIILMTFLTYRPSGTGSWLGTAWRSQFFFFLEHYSPLMEKEMAHSDRLIEVHMKRPE